MGRATTRTQRAFHRMPRPGHRLIALVLFFAMSRVSASDAHGDELSEEGERIARRRPRGDAEARRCAPVVTVFSQGESRRWHTNPEPGRSAWLRDRFKRFR